MWKDRFSRKNIMGLYIKYKVSTSNIDLILSKLKRENISVYNIKRIDKKSTYFTINSKDEQKFFAITNNLCYNIKEVKVFGKGYPIYLSIKKLGVTFGIIFFNV